MPRPNRKFLLPVQDISSGEEISDLDDSEHDSTKFLEISQNVADNDAVWDSDASDQESNVDELEGLPASSSDNVQVPGSNAPNKSSEHRERKTTRIKIPVSIPERKTSKGTAYSKEEDEKILKHIIINKHYSLLKGNKLWMQMEEDNVVPNRTWQSLKDRFRRHILEHIVDYRLHPKYRMNLIDAMKPGPTKTHDESPEDTSQQTETHPNKTASRGAPYTKVEDMAIVSYILNPLSSVTTGIKGNVLWQELEKSDKVPGRTWQGLKERFMKRILPNLYNYAHPGLTENKAKQILHAAGVSSDKSKSILHKLNQVSRCQSRQ